MKKGNISTRAGDKGRTGIGGGGRVDKDDKRIEALGDLDELNSFIGLLRTHLDQSHDWDPHFVQIQTELMNLMGHVATPSDAERRPALPLPEEATQNLEEWMHSIEETLPTSTEHFLLPGGNQVSALCQVIRTVARRAERRLVTLNKSDPVDPSILRFINRLSDLFFKLARQESHRKGLEEKRWRLFIPDRTSD